MRDIKGDNRSAILSLAGKQYRIIATVTFPGLLSSSEEFQGTCVVY